MNLPLVYRYILSLSKNGNMFYEKPKKQKDQKKKGRESDVGVNVLSVTPRLLNSEGAR